LARPRRTLSAMTSSDVLDTAGRGRSTAITAVGHSILTAVCTCSRPASYTTISAATTSPARTPTARLDDLAEAGLSSHGQRDLGGA
jgi:hypothetical protein